MGSASSVRQGKNAGWHSVTLEIGTGKPQGTSSDKIGLYQIPRLNSFQPGPRASEFKGFTVR